MNSVKVKLRPSSTPGKEGKIYFQVSYQGKSFQVKTDYSLFPYEWDKTTERILSNGASRERARHLAAVQAGIDMETKRLMAVATQFYNDTTAPNIYLNTNENYQATTSKSFLEFMESIINELRRMKKERTSEAYNAALVSFKKFLKGQDLSFDELTAELVVKYEAWLKKESVSLNTVSFYMRIIRATYNRAVDKQLVMQSYPFKHVYVGVAKTAKRAVTLKVIKKIKQLDLSRRPAIELARDIFMFSFYTRGMSFVDIAYLRQSNLRNGVLTYHRKKTRQQLHIKWERCMQDIVNKHHEPGSPFLLPLIHQEDEKERKQYLNALRFINHKLKQISILAGVTPKLTMYVARHSWASIAKSKKVPLSVISEGLGHSSELMTRIYLASFEDSVIDKANKKILQNL